jgi:hypothetical protein
MWHRNIDCLGVAVAVTSEVEEIDSQLAAVFRTYADAPTPPAVSYRLHLDESPTVRRSDGWTKRCDAIIDLVPVLELDLYREVAARATGLVLHAAAVAGADGRALVFPGVSGAGKSTLMRGLLANGFAYVSEECIAVAAEGTCVGLSRAMHIDDATDSLPPGGSCEPYVIRTRTGTKTTRLFHPSPEHVWRAPAAIAAIVCLDHGDDASNQLQSLGVGPTIVRVWPMVLRQRVEDAVAVAGSLARIPCFGLRTTSARNALERVLGLAKDLGVAPRP